MSGIVVAHERYCPPAASAFPTAYGTNSETPTLLDTSDRGLRFLFGSSPAGASDNHRFVARNKPTASNYDIIARLRRTPLGFQYFTPGLYLTDGTKLIFFGSHNGGAQMMIVNQWWNTQSSFNSNRGSGSNTWSRDASEDVWYRIGVVTGVPTDYYTSQNGKDWVKLYSEAATGFLTFTQIGFGCDVNRNAGMEPIASTPQAYVDCLYWSDGDISPLV